MAYQKLIHLFVYSTLISISFSSNNDFDTLLEFKSNTDSSNHLSSWSKNSTMNPCSSWLGVECDSSTRRVTKLILNNLNLTGSIEPLSSLTQLRHLSLENNSLNSSPKLSSWPNMKHLYLSNNHFSGTFPSGISHLRRLHRLDLSYNELSGDIPMNELIQLPYLLTLRLEFNSFTGALILDAPWPIPFSDFNVSNNDLAGNIPSEISIFPESSFAGNHHLCGTPLPFNCTIMQPAKSVPIPIKGSEKDKKRLSYQVVLIIIFIDVAAVILAAGCITWCCYRKNNVHKKESKNTNENEKSRKVVYNGIGRGSYDEEMVFFEGCKGFKKVEDLLSASAEMLGRGSVGTTYKVVMDGGGEVVVKRVREKLRRMKEVEKYLREIGVMRHGNAVSLRAYYYSKGELLLVFDFFRNGSLHKLLHGNRGPSRTPLDWTTRLKLALGSATGLAFIHNYNKSKLVHGQLTSRNILIDHRGNACIADIGLIQLLQGRSRSSNDHIVPQQRVSNDENRFSQKSDIYNFGLILLEILTGRIKNCEEGLSLVEWVNRVLNKESKWDDLDFELSRYKEMEEEMVALLQVSMLCVAKSPRDRPIMTNVMKMIQDICKGDGSKGNRIELNHDGLSSDSLPSLGESTLNFTSN
ncbi:hypothetical protein Leryth_018310 [Lithospermum erythrorhizon]|nr:hypothetical protein Leryth_018310 [Lithospermum erythrorhizon]